MTDATPAQIAAWMADCLDQTGRLHHRATVREIAKHFGEEFIYSNRAGNPAISRSVLAAFRELTSDTVVWHRRGRYWRTRTETDVPGRAIPGKTTATSEEPASGGMIRRTRRRKDAPPPRPLKHMTDDERRAFFDDMRARTAAIMATKTAFKPPHPVPDPETP